MDKPSSESRSKSHIDQGELYFWTATINKSQRLLEKDEYKNVIIESLQYLTDENKVDVFAFIIMPNHIHLIWRVNEPNGKESPQGSFLKYTAHIFKKMLKDEGRQKFRPPGVLPAAISKRKILRADPGIETCKKYSLVIVTNI